MSTPTKNPHALPWTFTGGALLDCKGENAATKANGPLIAQAVNERAELVAALREMVFRFDHMAEDSPEDAAILNEAHQLIARIPQP